MTERPWLAGRLSVVTPEYREIVAPSTLPNHEPVLLVRTDPEPREQMIEAGAQLADRRWLDGLSGRDVATLFYDAWFGEPADD